MSVEQLVADICREAKKASRTLASISTDRKNAVLLDLAQALLDNKPQIQDANQGDVEKARQAGLTNAMIDRLTLSDKVIQSMVDGLREVATLLDPVGEVTSMWKRPNGLLVGRQRIPLGVIGFIYESRPNVTVDAAALCLKSGNTVVLKGGKESLASNLALTEIIGQVLLKHELPKACVQAIPTTDRAATSALLAQDETLDVIIPRGGEGLIRFVAENAKMPVLKHYKGVCHVYVDESADHDMALAIAINAKCQRPGVCNAMETLLVNQKEADAFIPRVADALTAQGVEIRGCPLTCALATQAKPAAAEDWSTEYNDLILSIKVVQDMDAALDHINLYGSQHTEAIVTKDYARGRRFLDQADSSVVLINASTRFNDGGQLGLGAEIGISTSKLHAFGPMGLSELTTLKFVVFGEGQVRD